jgi:uncharacterized protein (TIGR02996 family)
VLVHEVDMLGAVEDSPDDDEPRLIYADFLQTRGDPRGELIAVQCALAKQPDADGALRQREAELLGAHARAWRAELGVATIAAHFTRGFISEAVVLASDLAARGARALETRPSPRWIVVRSTLADIEALAKLPQLARVSSLEVSGNWSDGDWSITVLAASRFLGGLRTLALRFHRIDLSGIRAIAEAPSLAKLVALDLGGNFLASEAQAALDELLAMGSVERLLLPGTNLAMGASRALARAPKCAVRSLDIASNRLDDAALAALLEGPWSRLEELWAFGNTAGERGARAVAALPALVSIDLGGNRIGPGGARALAQARGLRVLRLAHCEVGDAGAKALAERTADLEMLDLRGNVLSNSTRAQLIERYAARVRLHQPRTRVVANRSSSPSTGRAG